MCSRSWRRTFFSRVINCEEANVERKQRKTSTHTHCEIKPYNGCCCLCHTSLLLIVVVAFFFFSAPVWRRIVTIASHGMHRNRNQRNIRYNKCAARNIGQNTWVKRFMWLLFDRNSMDCICALCVLPSIAWADTIWLSISMSRIQWILHGRLWLFADRMRYTNQWSVANISCLRHLRTEFKKKKTLENCDFFVAIALRHQQHAYTLKIRHLYGCSCDTSPPKIRYLRASMKMGPIAEVAEIIAVGGDKLIDRFGFSITEFEFGWHFFYGNVPPALRCWRFHS